MCLQDFVYYKCGHSQIFTQHCEHPEELPFALTVNCPNYKPSRINDDDSCGLGKYYCSKTKDGPFLDHVHNTYATVESWMLKIDAELSKVITAANTFAENASRIQMPQHAWPREPVYMKIIAAYHSLANKRSGMEVTKVEAGQIIVNAMRYFRQVMRGRSVFDANVSLPPILNAPSWTQNPLQSTTDRASPPPTIQRADVPPGYIGIPIEPVEGPDRQQSQSEDPSRQSKDPPHHVPAQVSESTHNPFPSLKGQLPGINSLLSKATESDNITVRARAVRRSGKKQTDRNKPIPESAEKQVRRSGRVRNKVVKYAESSGSSLPPSRSASPEKSDAYVSESSPERFANTISSAKRSYTGPGNRNLLQESPEQHRTNSSLKDMISDWGIRMNSKSPTPPADMMAQTKNASSLQANIENSKSNDTISESLSMRASRFRGGLYSHGDSDTTQRNNVLHHRLTQQLHEEVHSQVQQHTSRIPSHGSRDYQRPTQTPPYTSPENMRSLVNTAYNNANPGEDIVGARNDSVMEMSHSTPRAARRGDYQDMRSSFNSTPNLAGYKQSEETMEANEPNKRKSLAKDETTPAKRIRLSFPHHKVPGASLDSKDAMLISPEMTLPVTVDFDIQNLIRYQGQRKGQEHRSMAPPAPMLHPSRVRYTQQVPKDEELLPGEDRDMEMDHEFQAEEQANTRMDFSDIDWNQTDGA